MTTTVQNTYYIPFFAEFTITTEQTLFREEVLNRKYEINFLPGSLVVVVLILSALIFKF